MKLTKNTDFKIAKGQLKNVYSTTEPLDYDKWVQFIDNNSDYFIWNEDTEEGKKSLMNIDSVPEGFKERVLESLNKGGAYAEFDKKRNLYNISLGINLKYNWITIQFARSPKLEDLKIFVEMARYLDAMLLVNGTKIIDEKTLESIS